MTPSNEGYPDPENPNENLHASNEFIVTVSDTDTDEEENPYNGYEPLPINDYNEIANNEEQEDNQEEQSPDDSIPPIPRMEDVLVRNVWSETRSEAVDIKMDSNKVDEVKQAMSSITLPASSIPEWAHNIPEDQWKQQLMKRLENMQKN